MQEGRQKWVANMMLIQPMEMVPACAVNGRCTAQERKVEVGGMPDSDIRVQIVMPRTE